MTFRTICFFFRQFFCFLRKETHVINLDVPEEPTHYLHRAGRCGRKGLEGTAITIVTPYERKWVHKYEKAWGLNFEQKEMSYGKLVDSQKTKKDIVKPMKKKKLIIEDKWVEGDGWGEFGDWEDDIIIEVGGGDSKKKKQKKDKNDFFSSSKPQKKDGKKDKKGKKKDDEMGFFAKKAKKLAEKEANRAKSQKK